MSVKGRLYAIGAGPGHVEWLTLHADRILKQVEVIAVPQGQGGKGRAEQIIASYITPAKVLLQLHFPMITSTELLTKAWDEAALQVASFLTQGQDVAFVTEGDPSLFSTFYYLLQALRVMIPDVALEIIPGISSIFGASAILATPLVMGAESLAVVPASSNLAAVAQALQHFDTVVILKIARVFEQVLAMLDQKGLVERTVYVENVGYSHARVVMDVHQLDPHTVPYMSLFIVRSGLQDARESTRESVL
ncbi:MAG: precorrin-2 C(20)-methyltransferase [Sulfobacillus thermosulfidooxidans]|nr:MAG: precorrin-2 C(20)-methyltransferase [Sulfobacillus thermosulfidooxidans]